MPRTVDERLRAAADLFRERNATYGANYQLFGPVMLAMFPEGISVRTAAEMGRLVHVSHMVTKLTRYARNLTRGGHADSLEDLSVYAQMQAEMDDLARETDGRAGWELHEDGTQSQSGTIFHDDPVSEAFDSTVLGQRLQARGRAIKGWETRRRNAKKNRGNPRTL